LILAHIQFICTDKLYKWQASEQHPFALRCSLGRVKRLAAGSKKSLPSGASTSTC
jgi:hypothetical protein